MNFYVQILRYFNKCVLNRHLDLPRTLYTISEIFYFWLEKRLQFNQIITPYLYLREKVEKSIEWRMSRSIY